MRVFTGIIGIRKNKSHNFYGHDIDGFSSLSLKRKIFSAIFAKDQEVFLHEEHIL